MPAKTDVKKIILSGGHAGTTALAVVEELTNQNRKFRWDIYWIGSNKAIEGRNVPTLESQELPKMGVKSYSIFTGRIQQRFTIWTIPSILKIPIGFINAFYLLFKINPDIILSFGGYAAFPVVVVGWLRRIPIVIHEQTLIAGLANKYSSFFARVIALARPESKSYYRDSGKCVVVGNPLAKVYFTIKAKEKLTESPTILITGGSRGSNLLNETVEKILPVLLSKYKIIHHVGFLNAIDKFNKMKSMLPVDSKKNYRVFTTVEPNKMADYFKEADIVISRAGANSVAQIILTKRPSILIPIPFIYGNEQIKNAEFAKKFGIAEIIKQSSLTPEKLYRQITDTFSNWKKIVKSVRNKVSPDVGASVRLVNLVENIVKTSSRIPRHGRG